MDVNENIVAAGRRVRDVDIKSYLRPFTTYFAELSIKMKFQYFTW